MGRGPDRKPRARRTDKPNRTYVTLPDTEVTRLNMITLRPKHIWLLRQLFPGKGISPSIQEAIETLASSSGIDPSEWDSLSEEHKFLYVSGQRSSTRKGRESTP